MSSDPTIFVVDDDKDARDSVCALCATMGLSAKSYSSAEEFLLDYDMDQPGCLITDIRMLGASGLDLQRKLIEDGCRLPVIVISGYVDVENTVKAMQAGAVTVLVKPCEQRELQQAISGAVKQAARLRIDQAHHQDLLGRFAQLRPGEKEVLDLIARGKMNKTVAKELGISLRTVEDRRRKIYQKLGVDNLASMMQLVIEERQIQEEPPQTAENRGG